MCTALNGALNVPKLVTDESIAGHDDDLDRRVPADGLPPAAPVRPGQRWARHLLADQPGGEGSHDG